MVRNSCLHAILKDINGFSYTPVAVAELRGFHVSLTHVKFGIAAIFVACIQPVNAFLRPPRQSNGEQASYKRIIWEYLHIIVGRCTIAVSIAALLLA